MKKRSSLLLIAILGLSMLVSINPVAADFSVDVYINDAYYADIDGDGAEDDITVDLSIYLYNNQVYTDIDIYVGITLPSGMDFWFTLSFTAEKYTYSGTVNMRWDLFNTALESGWYRADAVGFAEGEQFSYMDSLIFDPPGQTGGVDPARGTATFY